MISSYRPKSNPPSKTMQNKPALSTTSFRSFLFDAIIVSVLVAGIIGSALSVAFQAHETRQEFKVWQKSKKTRDQLDVEWGRLLIEQQTFGATTQIASRAVIYLHMYSPPGNQILTLTLPDAHGLSTYTPAASMNTNSPTDQSSNMAPQGVAP
jgi:cell division protein FtsL